MDASGKTKYPVLFGVYGHSLLFSLLNVLAPRLTPRMCFFTSSGAPTSQMVTNRYKREWEYYISSHMRYIVVVVDGRGSNYKGRKFRNPVRGKLGHWEPLDQISAAR